jgi:CTP:molybdopterin cytidylyltransferase MocA
MSAVAAGLVLAAGSGSRFGQPKAPVVVDGERLVDRAVRVLGEAGCDPIVVVLGAWVGHVEGADIVVNDTWPEGMGSSLRTGLTHLRDATEAEKVVITLVDLPGLTTPAVERLLTSSVSAPAAQCTYHGEPGHPVCLARALWDEAIEVAHGDEGARRLMREREDLVLVEVGDVADGTDLDQP